PDPHLVVLEEDVVGDVADRLAGVLPAELLDALRQLGRDGQVLGLDVAHGGAPRGAHALRRARGAGRGGSCLRRAPWIVRPRVWRMSSMRGTRPGRTSSATSIARSTISPWE